MSRGVSAVGMISAAAQQQATAAETARPRPSRAARSFSQADAQMAPRISPGSTNGNSRLLAQGSSGATAGRYSTETITQPAIASGSAQTLAAARGSCQVSSAFRHLLARSAVPGVASSTVGRPMYQTAQYRLAW